jgi:periplasmic divalent cation tolerance protein
MIYITHENMEQAEKVVKVLLDKKLVACANIFPMKSMYFWKENLEKADEIVSIVKTKSENWELVKNEVLKIHPYETPCIIKIPVEANEDFENWINKETEG